jgi:signal transduction histidine kinase
VDEAASVLAAALEQAGEAARPAEALDLLLAALVERTGAGAGWVLEPDGRVRTSSGTEAEPPSVEAPGQQRLTLRARGQGVGTLVLTCDPAPLSADAAAAVVMAGVLLDNDRLAEEARLADQAREHFLVSLNHELRTPATGLVLVADLLRSARPDDFPELLVEWLGHAEKHVQRIMHVLEGLLEATAAIGAPLETDLVEPRRLAGDALRKVERAARKKGLRLALSFPPDLPLLQTDAHRCSRVLLQLLDNAIRFSERGEIRVRLDRIGRTLGGGRGALQIAVHDPGCGIPVDQLERVFEPFAQVEEGARNVETGRGVGLGLTIARRLARSLGGELSLASEGRGTVATFTVPYGRQG